MPRIPSTELRYIRRRLFGGQFTASALAESVEMTANALWVMFNRTGMTPGVAHLLARTLDGWSMTLGGAARDLRALAHSYEDKKLEKTA